MFGMPPGRMIVGVKAMLHKLTISLVFCATVTLPITCQSQALEVRPDVQMSPTYHATTIPQRLRPEVNLPANMEYFKGAALPTAPNSHTRTPCLRRSYDQGLLPPGTLLCVSAPGPPPKSAQRLPAMLHYRSSYLRSGMSPIQITRRAHPNGLR